jgi:hypothetical protein
MNTNELKMPEPLDRTKLHSPAVVRSHDKAVADYWQAVREAERAEAQAKEAAQAHSNRVISEDDYFQMAVARDNANRLKDLERQTAALAAEKEKQDYLASNPDVAEVVATNVAVFLNQLQHWHVRGYSVDFNGPLMTMPNLYHVMLNAPAKSTKGTK